VSRDENERGFVRGRDSRRLVWTVAALVAAVLFAPIAMLFFQTWGASFVGDLDEPAVNLGDPYAGSLSAPVAAIPSSDRLRPTVCAVLVVRGIDPATRVESLIVV
jgi:hypothetical protein